MNGEEHTGKTPIPPPKDRLKFDSDYDYQKANEQFQHESQMSPKVQQGEADGHKGESAMNMGLH